MSEPVSASPVIRWPCPPTPPTPSPFPGPTEIACLEVTKVYDSCFQTVSDRPCLCIPYPCGDLAFIPGTTVTCTVESTTCTFVASTTTGVDNYANLTFALTADLEFTLTPPASSACPPCTFTIPVHQLVTATLCTPSDVTPNCMVVGATCGPSVLIGEQVCTSYTICLVFQTEATVNVLVPTYGFCAPAPCQVLASPPCPPVPTDSCAPAPSPSPSPSEPVVVWLKSQNGSSASGTATLYFSAPDTLEVVVRMTGLVPESIHPSHIHEGECGSHGAILYDLTDVMAGADGTDTAVTTLHGMTEIPAHGWYVNVHEGPTLEGAGATVIACGTISLSASIPSPA